ncbi:MAG: NAD kinase [Flavobacteriia bacterium]|nr:NAD kinase [Flavobacteriia bacterium]
MKNIAVYGKKVNKSTAPYFLQILQTIEKFSWKVVLEKELKEQLEKKLGQLPFCDTFNHFSDFTTGIDLVLSVGGDGTFLKTVKYIRNSGVPIVGVNTGRLGFLASVNTENLESVFQQIKNKNFDYQHRSMLKIDTNQQLFGEDNYAMNEVTLHKKDTASMITVHVKLDDNYLNSYWADGLIVSTPTGSTAYNLSCGGPIVTPGCQIHILTPIAPHNLNVRPMVVPDKFPIKLSVEGRERKCLISIDSISKNINQGEEVIVTKASFLINVVKFYDSNFLDTIRKKMSWGMDQRN